jgi:tRNA 2-selenouridine synthase
VVRELLVKHYDPVYLQSMKRNFDLYDEAQTLRPAGHSVEAMGALARKMVGSPQDRHGAALEA